MANPLYVCHRAHLAEDRALIDAEVVAAARVLGSGMSVDSAPQGMFVEFIDLMRKDQPSLEEIDHEAE